MNGFNDMCEKFGLHSNFQCGCDYKKNSNQLMIVTFTTWVHMPHIQVDHIVENCGLFQEPHSKWQVEDYGVESLTISLVEEDKTSFALFFRKMFQYG